MLLNLWKGEEDFILWDCKKDLPSSSLTALKTTGRTDASWNLTFCHRPEELIYLKRPTPKGSSRGEGDNRMMVDGITICGYEFEQAPGVAMDRKPAKLQSAGRKSWILHRVAELNWMINRKVQLVAGSHGIAEFLMILWILNFFEKIRTGAVSLWQKCQYNEYRDHILFSKFPAIKVSRDAAPGTGLWIRHPIFPREPI